MQTKQSVTNNHQPSTACGEKRAAMKLPIRSTVIAAFGVLAVLLPAGQTAHAEPFGFNLVPASDPIAACLPDAVARATVFPREELRGVDTVGLRAHRLRPHTTFPVFLTEIPVPPLGRAQYIQDCSTNAHGTG